MRKHCVMIETDSKLPAPLASLGLGPVPNGVNCSTMAGDAAAAPPAVPAAAVEAPRQQQQQHQQHFEDELCRQLSATIFVRSENENWRERCDFLENCIRVLLRHCEETGGVVKALERENSLILKARKKVISQMDAPPPPTTTSTEDSPELAALHRKCQQFESLNSELNKELTQVMAENHQMLESVEHLREEVVTLRHSLERAGEREDKDCDDGLLEVNGDCSRDSDDNDDVESGKDEEAAASKRKKAKHEHLLIEEKKMSTASFTAPRLPSTEADCWGIDEEEEDYVSLKRSSERDGDSSSGGEKASEVIANLRATAKALRAEVLSLKRRQAALVRDMIVRDGDLVKCEQELLDCQRDLDDNKEECYGHMKVIQELKVAPREGAVGRRKELLAAAGKGQAETANIFNLKLELVDAKRKLKASEDEFHALRTQQQAFNTENENLKEDLRYLLDKYVGKGKPLVKEDLSYVPDLEGHEKIDRAVSCSDLTRAASAGEVICGLRKELVVQEYCLQQHLQYCAENHVDVAVLHEHLTLASTNAVDAAVEAEEEEQPEDVCQMEEERKDEV